MSPERDTPQLKQLRGMAETMLDNTLTQPSDQEQLPETQRLMHELQVQQVELEMQTDELSRAIKEVRA